MSRAGHTRNLFSKPAVKANRVVRPVAPVALEFVGETRYVVTEAGEGHCVIDAVVTLAADPVRQIHHEVHVREDVRVFHVLVAECRVVLVLAALNLQAGTHYGWNHLVSEKSACQLMWLKRDDPKSSFPSVPLKTIIWAPPATVISQLSKKRLVS